MYLCVRGTKPGSEPSCVCVLEVPSQECERSCICVLEVPSQESEPSCICVLEVPSQKSEPSCISVLEVVRVSLLMPYLLYVCQY